MWWVIDSLQAETNGTFTASGTLEGDEVLVGTEVLGRILTLPQEGREVNGGATVAQLDDSLIQLQIRQALDPATRLVLQKQAELYQLHSPVSGIVTRVPTNVGEVVSPGQTVLAVADLSHLSLTAYILEQDLGRVRVDQSVVVSADPFPDRTFSGRVTSINSRAEFTPRNVQTRADRLNLVFGVKVEVNNPDGALKLGMPVDVTFGPAP